MAPLFSRQFPGSFGDGGGAPAHLPTNRILYRPAILPRIPRRCECANIIPNNIRILWRRSTVPVPHDAAHRIALYRTAPGGFYDDPKHRRF